MAIYETGKPQLQMDPTESWLREMEEFGAELFLFDEDKGPSIKDVPHEITKIWLSLPFISTGLPPSPLVYADTP